MGVPVEIGWDNLPSLVGIGLTDLPSIGVTGASGPPGPPVPASLELVGTSNYITKETFLKYELVELKLPFIDNTRSLREGLLKSVSNHCPLKSKMCQKIRTNVVNSKVFNSRSTTYPAKFQKC